MLQVIKITYLNRKLGQICNTLLVNSIVTKGMPE